MIERQELFCHNCKVYVQFDLDLELNGNHVLECPNCKHEHCRVVNNGIISDKRWDSKNNYVIPLSTLTYSTTTTFDLYNSANSTTSGYTVPASSGTDVFTYMSWMNSSTVGGSF